MRLLAAALLSVSLAASQLMAQTLPGIGRTGDVVTKIESRFEPATAKPGDRVTWRLTLVVNPGWHVYATRQADASSSNVTDITFPNTLGLRAISEVVDPPEPKLQPDIDGGEPLKYFEGLVKFERTFEVTKDAPAGRVAN